MDEGDQVNIRRQSPEQQNSATNTGSANSRSESNVTIKLSGNAPILVVITTILFITVVVAGIYILWTQVLPKIVLSSPASPPNTEVAVPTTDESQPESVHSAAPEKSVTALPENNTSSAAPTSTPVENGKPAESAFKPIGSENTGGEVQAASIGGNTSKNQSFSGNIVVCVPSNVVGRATIHLWRLSVDRITWEELEKRSIGRIDDPRASTVKIDGSPIDATSWGAAGQPYRLELWMNSTPVKSIGNTSKGEKEFRVYKDIDNIAPDTFCQ